MFELENAIADWRNSILQDDAMTPESVAELEEHLRETVDSLHGASINDDEAFVIAKMRLGTTDALTGEYGKVNEGLVWLKRLAWMTAGYLGGGVVEGLIGGSAALAAAAICFAGLPGSISGVASALFMAACWRGLFHCLMTPKQRWRRSWSPIVLVCMLVLGTLAGYAMIAGVNLISSRYLGSGQYGESLMWLAYGSLLIRLGVFTGCLYLIFRHQRDLEVANG